jgi:hypothetical protein
MNGILAINIESKHGVIKGATGETRGGKVNERLRGRRP